MNQQHFSINLGRKLLALVVAYAGFALPGIALADTQYVEGDVIVTFKGNTTLDGAKTALSKKALSFSKHFNFLSDKRKRHTGLVHHATKTTAQLIADLKNDPTVETVEPNYIRWVSAVPDDTRFAEQWPLQNTGQIVNGDVGVSGDDVKFLAARNLSRPTAKEIVVAVLDTGVDYLHPDLVGNMWVNKSETLTNNTDDDSNGYIDDIYGYDFVSSLPDPQDSGQHGTHVAGTIAAIGNNQKGIIGINDRAKIMALKVSADGNTINTAAVISAVQYATMMKNKGVNIVAINASYGGGGNSAAESAAIKAAGDAGIIFCAAAGNDSTDNDITPSYPAGYRLANMIVVAASDQSDKLASFSNYGATTVDIAAPGTNILSAKPSDVAFKVDGTTYTSVPLTYSGTTTGLSGMLVDCGLGNPSDFPAAVNGNVALIARGTLTFSTKVTNAMAAGAIAAIIYNNVSPGTFLGTLQTSSNWIPSRAISLADGLALKGLLQKTASIVVTPGYQFLEGTSMATPHVTGSAAFAAMNFPGETVAQRIQRILAAVDLKSTLSGKIATGGRLNLLMVVDANANGIADWIENPDLTVPTITSTSPLAEAVIGIPYTTSLVAVGGKTPYTWTLSSGSPPDGFTLSSTGDISGTFASTGVSSFSALVTDADGLTDLRAFTITCVQTALAISTPATLPNGMVHGNYSQALSATGGAAPFAWSLKSGTLPAGLSLSSQGIISGTPTADASYDFTARVTDGGGGSVEQAFTLLIEPQHITITNATALPNGMTTAPYSATFIATGGNGGYIWTVASGSLPAGLTLATDGKLTGIPSEAGTFDFTLHVIDNTALVQDKSFQFVVSPSPITISSAPALVSAVKSVSYAQLLTATGGSAPYVWTINSGALPKGITLSTGGALTGIPSMAGDFSFIARTTDAVGIIATRSFSLRVDAFYSVPVMNALNLGSASVGVHYTNNVSAANYPKSFVITGLPAGLSYVSTTGVIKGRPTVSGTFNVTVKATNPAGTSAIVQASLVVDPVPLNNIGSFAGIIGRDAAVNSGLGSKFTLTTSKIGYYTLKVTTGGTTKSLVGYMLATKPQISVPIGKGVVAFTLDETSNLITSPVGSVAVHGWRSTWNTLLKPANSRMGYYSVGIQLANIADQGVVNIPQGSGYATFSVASSGSFTLAGKTADNQTITSGGFMGPSGEMVIHTSLYGYRGSITGSMVLSEAPAIADNEAIGTLTWSRPISVTHTYPNGFAPLDLKMQGKYLATSSKGQIVLGLPAVGTASLAFTDGGLASATLDPDVAAFSYSNLFVVTLPVAGSTDNPASAKLSINKNTGAVSGSFTLIEPSPLLKRAVTFHGQIVRPALGNSKALGYFLLQQIPPARQSLSTSPILSGGMSINQP